MNNSKLIQLKIILLFFNFAQIVCAKTIIWDLGDTLFRTSRFEMAYNIGFSHFLSYAIFDWQNPDIQPLVFDILEKINPEDENPKEGRAPEVPTDNEGRPLPVIMHKWLAGIISSSEIIKSINEYLDHLELANFFTSKRQKNLVKRTLDTIFNPQILADCTYPIEDGIKLLEECHNAKNILIVLSNWDEVSFNLLKKRYTHIFDKYFRHVVISGAIGLIKPRKEAFEYVIRTYEFDPKDCIFIDDQYDNTLAAQSVGITALLLCKNNYKTLKQMLIKLGALS